MELPTGYVLTRGKVKLPHYPRLAHLLVNVTSPRYQADNYPTPRSLDAHLVDQARIRNSLLFSVGIGEVIPVISSFLPNIKDLGEYSDDFWFKLFLSSVRVGLNSERVKRAIQKAWETMNTKEFVKAKTWSYQLYSNSDVLYWWSKKMHPLRSRPPSENLLELFQTLVQDYPDVAGLEAFLVGLYSDMRQKLRSHRDKELYDWLGGYESVGAVFCGLPRSLAFGPHFLYKKLGPNNPDHLTIKINCTTSNFVHILPFANKYFVHSKLGARRNGTSMTITFRRGIPPTAAKVMYPHQYSKIFR